MSLFKAKKDTQFKWHMTYYFADRVYIVSFPDTVEREEQARSVMKKYYDCGFKGQMSVGGDIGDVVINLNNVQYVTLEKVEVDVDSGEKVEIKSHISE